MAEKTRSQGKYNSIKSKKQPLCARTLYSCYKLVLFLYALCYLLIGLALLGIGIFVEIERRQYTWLDTSLSLPVALLIFVGFFVSVNGLCGVVGTVDENVSLLRMFLILSIASFLAQVATAVVIYVYSLDVSSFVSSELAQALKDYNMNSKLRKTMNMVQYKYSCCGISSWHDYVDIVGVCQDGGCIFPESCCSLPQLPSDYNNCTADTIAEVPPTMTVKLGCFNAFVDWLGGRMDLIGSTTLGFALPQVVGIVWTYLVLRKIREWQCWYTVELATDYENRL